MRRTRGNPLLGLATAAVVAAALLAWSPAARADGDPASDVLYSQRAFLPYDVAFPSRLEQQLRQLLAASSEAGYPIRVAIVASDYDLGSVGQLWGKPRTYARFLGIELSLGYRGLLLVVMPGGFGLYHAGRPVTGQERALRTTAIRPGGRGLAQTAIDAVRRLASIAGHPLTLPQPRPAAPTPATHPSAHRLRGWLIVGAGLLLAALAWTVSLRRRPLQMRAPLRRSVALLRRAGPIWGLVALLGVVLLAANVLLGARSAPGARANPRPRAAAPAVTWPRGASRAPALDLVDEHGGPVSLSRNGGRPTIVTFIDPVCRNYCPLEAQVLNRAIALLPAAARPRVVAVSVNPPADTTRNVLLDKTKWHLTPSWHWAFGTRAQLARVWHAYGISVATVPQTAAGITIEKLVHTEAAYVVDVHGYRRALFLWPFKVSTVESAIRSAAGRARA